MAKVEPTDGKLQIAGKTFIRTSDSSRVWDLSLRADQVALVRDHSFFELSRGTRDKRPCSTYVALKGRATIEGYGAGVAILGSEIPPIVQLSIDITPYDEPKSTDDSVWAERARTSWPASVWAEEVEWHLILRVPRSVHEQLVIAVAAGRLVHLKFAVKLDAWMEEKGHYLDDPIVYLPPQEGKPDQTDIIPGHITQLMSQERPLVLTEPMESAAPERSATSLQLELLSQLRTVQRAVWALFVAVVLIGMIFLVRK